MRPPKKGLKTRVQIKDDTVRPTRCGKGGKHSVGVSVRKRPMDENG